MAEQVASASDVLETIGAGSGRRWRWWLRRILAVVVVIVAAVMIAVLWTSKGGDSGDLRYVTAPVERAELRATVEATGTAKAVDQVEVGAEIGGTILSVSADFNDQVKAGQVLCVIDPEKYTAALEQAKAQLATARAELRSRDASAKEAALAAERTRGLIARGVTSRQELESAEATAARAEAATAAARAQIRLAQAALASARIALHKTSIRAPIDGVVLGRTVEPGQTVAASFQTPVLFVLARDLTKMELEIDIDEADVGRVREGQAASFTVDAYPERRFSAVVDAIHNLSTVVDNVVTYRAVLSVDNSKLVLRPGMTTTVTIVTATRSDVLLVPNAALRFTPPSKIKQRPGGPRFLSFNNDDKRGRARPENQPRGKGNTATVWMLEADEPVPVRIETGLSDGELTEVVSGKLEEGAAVLVDVAARSSS